MEEVLRELNLLKEDIKECKIILLGSDSRGITPRGNAKKHLLNHIRLIELQLENYLKEKKDEKIS